MNFEIELMEKLGVAIKSYVVYALAKVFKMIVQYKDFVECL